MRACLALFLVIPLAALAQLSPFNEVPIATDPPAFVGTADVNRDGNPDLLVASSTANTVSVLLGDGQGHFSHATGSPIAVAPRPVQIEVGDFNKDGKMDLAVLHSGVDFPPNLYAPALSVLFGNGSGLGPYAGNPIRGDGTFAADSTLMLYDFDGDGDLDMVLTNGSVPYMIPGDGSGNFAAPTIQCGFCRSGKQGVLGDFNADGKIDVASFSNQGSLLQISGSDGRGRIVSDLGQLMNGFRLTAMRSADLNGDGTSDLLVMDQSKRNVYPWLGSSGRMRSWSATANWPETVEAPEGVLDFV